MVAVYAEVKMLLPCTCSFPWLPFVCVYNRAWFICDVTILVSRSKNFFCFVFCFAVQHNLKDICESGRVWGQNLHVMLSCYTRRPFLIA